MGAVSRRGILTRLSVSVPGRLQTHPYFDVEQFRVLSQRQALARTMERPTLVLGSTQPIEVVDAKRADALGVDVVRRRGGGGAVLLLPGDHLWIEAWVPRDDPLWDDDVARAARWVGAWWSAALAALGAGGCDVHEGAAERGPLDGVVCFSGRGPGEVFVGARKVMGLSQWRSRQGALFHSCAYARWDPRPLVELLSAHRAPAELMVSQLSVVAQGVDDLGVSTLSIPTLRNVLLASFPNLEGDQPIRLA